MAEAREKAMKLIGGLMSKRRQGAPEGCNQVIFDMRHEDELYGALLMAAELGLITDDEFNIYMLSSYPDNTDN